MNPGLARAAAPVISCMKFFFHGGTYYNLAQAVKIEVSDREITVPGIEGRRGMFGNETYRHPDTTRMQRRAIVHFADQKSLQLLDEEADKLVAMLGAG